MSRSPTLQEKHPELFAINTDVDPRKRKRVMPMKVLSLGMPRTGTACMLSLPGTRYSGLTLPPLALQLALNILGYPCYHGLTLIANVRDTEMWNEALDAKFFGKGSLFTQSDWDQLLGNYSAVADLPAVAFSEDLLHCYPDAKVVLVERDIERWYQSFNDGVIMNVRSPVVRLIARLDTRFVGKLGATSQRWTEGWFGAHSRREMQYKARAKYHEHYALVERVTLSDRLLKFNLGDGGGPLCKFLNKPIPNIEFPRVNESAALSEKIGLIVQRGTMNALGSSSKVLLPLVVLVIAWWIIRAKIYI